VVSDAGPVGAKKSKRGRKIQASAARPVVGNSGGRMRPASGPRRRPHHTKVS